MDQDEEILAARSGWCTCEGACAAQPARMCRLEDGEVRALKDLTIGHYMRQHAARCGHGSAREASAPTHAPVGASAVSAPSS
jgi:hypothetical protein